jgi:hypothetical protein
MSPVSLLFFFLFAGVLFFMYLGVRRRFAPLSLVGVGGVLGSVLAMTLFGLAQGNVFQHALLVGLLVGGGLSVVTLATALYFQAQELRQG